jgi:two-component system cell cycle sensor histidine kinase/response regulator CckA
MSQPADSETQAAILNAIPAHIALVDSRGVILAVNASWKRFAAANVLQSQDFGVGCNYLEVCERAAGDCADEAGEAARGLRRVLAGELPEFTLEYPCHAPSERRWFRLMITPVSTERLAGAVIMHINVTERRLAEEALAVKSGILAAVTESLGAYVERGDWREAMGRLLRCALNQTQSEYGFVGVVVGASSLRVLAHEGIVWDKVLNRDFYEEALRRYEEVGYLEFTNFDNLFGRAITTGRVVMANMPDHDPRSGGRPPGHPPMHAFLGVPISAGQQVQGLIALANRPGGYSLEDQRRIETLVQHAGGLCSSYRQHLATRLMEQERLKAEEALRKTEREQRKLAEQLEKERAQLVAAQSVAKVGSWETNLADLTVVWSAETHRIFETDPATFEPTHASFLARVHPEDRAAVDQAFQKSFGTRKTQAIEHRLLLPDGRIKFIDERWQVVGDEEGRPARATGTCQDITVRKLAEQRIADAQRFNLTLIESSPLAIIAYRASGTGVAANTASMHMLGAPSVEAVRRQNFREIEAWQRSGLLAAADEALASGQPQEREIHLSNSFGKEIWLHCRLIPVNYEDEHYLLGFFDDIRERKRAEMERDRLFNLSLDLLCVAGFDGRLQQVNPAWTECLGWSAEELTSRPMLDFVHPDDRDATLRSRARIQQGQPSRGFENRYRCKDGSYRWLSWSVHSLAESQQVFGVARDVTERRKIVDALGRNEALLRMATQVSRLGAWQVELPALTLTWSDEVRAIHETDPGFTPAVEDGLNYYAPEFQERIREAFGACVEHGTPYDEELQIITARGRRVWVRTLGEAVRDEAGKIVRVQGAFQDISQQKQTELEIRRSAERLETTLESITDAFLTMDREWRFTYLNGEAERLMRRSRADLLGRNIWEEFPAAAGSAFQREYERAMRDNRTVGFQEFFPPLNLWVDVRAFPSAEGLAVYFRDITESRRVEERVAEQAALLDNAHDAIIVRDAAHQVTYWNKAAERLYGWTAAEALGRPLQKLLQIDAGKFAEAQRAINATGGWNGEIQKTAKNGAVLTVEGSWTLLRDGQGAPRSILTIDTDITERKKLEQQFLRAQRMESIGTLAGGIAHDLNNLLSPITMGVDLLRAFSPSPRSLPVIENIERSAKRGADLVKQVLSFARGVEGSRVALQVRHVLHEVESIANNTFPKNIAIKTSIANDLGLVMADPTQLNQVVLNLCVNARDAMPGGGHLTITASNVVIDEQYAVMNRGVAAGRYVMLEVTDTGCGMPREVIDRIFEPFYTTKELGHGTGLGLSTVLGIVRSHGGFVNVYSEVGKGSTFKVYLPVATDGSVAAAEHATRESLPRGNGELIMVVDDEASVLDITRQTLRAFGYQVVTAEDGAQAVGVYAMRREEVAVVLTDMMMPVMEGSALIIALQRINPKVRIIAASGLNVNNSVARVTSAGVKDFLAKPYTADALLNMLKRVLSEGGSRPPL